MTAVRIPVLNWNARWFNESYMSAAVSEGTTAAIWRRAIEPEKGCLPPAEARAILRLKLAEPDLDRADALAAKARAGKLTRREDQELENYLSVSSTLEFLKSKARRSLGNPESVR
jgi:hypothetical protein